MPRQKLIHKIFGGLIKTIKAIFIAFGIIFITMIILSLTNYPFWAYYHLGTANSRITATPDYIVVMGAGGMPGANGLMRCNFAAQAAQSFPEARIIIAMPARAEGFINSDAFKMYEEIGRGTVDPSRFIFETKGTDTYSQAFQIMKLLSSETQKNLLIVTSPEHLYRCILTFEKCGFDNVDGLPAFQACIDKTLFLTEKERSSDNVPLVRNVGLRYNMWSYFKMEVDVMREYMALAYYKFKGYI